MAEPSFSVRLKLITDEFNAAVNKSAQNYGGFIDQIRAKSEQMQADTAKLDQSLEDLFKPTGAREFISQLNQVNAELKSFGDGAKVNGDQVDRAFKESAVSIAKLNVELADTRVALSELEVNKANAGQISQLKNEIKQLEAGINGAERAVKEFGVQTAGAMNRAEDTAKQAENAIFKLLNIRSASTIKQEIEDINRELKEFKANSGAAGDELTRVSISAQNRLSELNREIKSVNASSNGAATGGVGNLKGQLIGFAAAYIGINEVLQGLRAVVQITKELDSINQKLEFATGSVEAARAKYDELRETANRLGLDQIQLARGFAELSAAGREAGLTAKEIDVTFEGVVSAVAAMSLTTEEANGVFTALSQIAGKGTVSMEELRQQLGERLTPALGVAARSMGLTVSELSDLVETGNLAANEFLPAFGAELTKTFGAQATKNIDTMTGKLNLLNNQFTDLKAKLGEGFVGDGLEGGLDLLATAIEKISQGADSIDPQALEAVKRIASDLVETLGTGFSTVFELVGNIDSALGAMFTAIGGGSAESADQVGFLTRTLQGLSIVIGIVKDGVSAIGIAATLTLGAVEALVAGALIALSKLTFGDLKDDLIAASDELFAAAKKNFDSAQQKALEFQSATRAALEDAVNGVADTAKAAADETALAYQQMAISGTASADELTAAQDRVREAAVVYGQQLVDANKGIVDSTVLAELAQRNLGFATDEAGKTIVSSMIPAAEAIASLQNEYADIAKVVGVELNAALLGVSKTFEKSRSGLLELSGDFDGLAEAGYDASLVLINSLDAMLEKAANPTELQSVIALWEHLGDQGQITGDQLVQGLERSRNALDDLTDGINSVSEAYRLFGLQTQEEARRQAEEYKTAYELIRADGNATAEQLEIAFTKYSVAAIAANKGVADSALKADAAIAGMSITTDDAGKSIVQSLAEAEEATNKVSESAGRARSGYQSIGSAALSASGQVVAASQQNVIAINSEIDAIKQRDAALSVSRGAEVRGSDNLGGLSIKAYSVENIKEALEKANYQGSIAAKAQDIFNGFVSEQQGKAFFSPGFAFTNADYVDTALAQLKDTKNGSVGASIPNFNRNTPIPDSPSGPGKTVTVNLNSNGRSVPISVSADQESNLLGLLNDLGQSKSVSGF